jgi:hypothetical protein
VLAVPDFSMPFTIETDASDGGFGAVLMQEGHPISYLSKPIHGKNQALSTYEKECMAVILAVDKWRSYLQGQQFTIKTDHRSLLFLKEQKASTKLQQKAILKLMDFNFIIQYKGAITLLLMPSLGILNPYLNLCWLSPLALPCGWKNLRKDMKRIQKLNN